MPNYLPGEEFEGVLTSENFIFHDRGGSLSSMFWAPLPASTTSTTGLSSFSAAPVASDTISSSNMKISQLRSRASSGNSEHHVGEIPCQFISRNYKCDKVWIGREWVIWHSRQIGVVGGDKAMLRQSWFDEGFLVKLLIFLSSIKSDLVNLVSLFRYPSVQVAQLQQAECDGQRAGGDLLQPAD